MSRIPEKTQRRKIICKTELVDFFENDLEGCRKKFNMQHTCKYQPFLFRCSIKPKVKI